MNPYTNFHQNVDSVQSEQELQEKTMQEAYYQNIAMGYTQEYAQQINPLFNNFEQARFEKELNKYNNRIVAKMHGLEKVPRVTKNMVQETIYNTIMSTTGYIEPHMLAYQQYDELPNRGTWRHACLYTGLIQQEVYMTQVYTTVVHFTFCAGCGKIHYHFEKREEEWV